MFLTKDNFEALFEANYRVQKVGLYPAISFALSFIELSQILPDDLSYYLDEDNGLGFCHHWFGIAHNQLFTITRFGNDSTLLSFREKQESEKYHWTFLENLVDLPKTMLQRIIWIRSEFILKNDSQDDAKSSIFYRSQHGIVFEAYRAKSLIEAEELLSFLQNTHSEIDYWIGEPKNSDSAWIITRILSGGDDKVVGRYPGRSMTEDSARYMSLRDNASYKTKEEKTNRHGLTFANGLIKKPTE